MTESTEWARFRLLYLGSYCTLIGQKSGESEIRANRTFDVAFLEDDLQLKLELKVDFFVIQFENRFRDEFSLVNSILHLKDKPVIFKDRPDF